MDFLIGVVLILLFMFLPILTWPFMAYRFRHSESPPTEIIQYLLLLCAFSVGFGLIPRLPVLLCVVCVVGGLGCFSVSVAFILRRTTGISFIRAYPIIGVLLLPVLAWADLRFCMIFVDTTGNLIDVRTGLQYSDPHYDSPGMRVTEGVRYFGFFQWMRYKGKWTFMNTISDKDLRYYHDLNWEPATWDQWPKIVILRPWRVP